MPKVKEPAAHNGLETNLREHYILVLYKAAASNNAMNNP